MATTTNIQDVLDYLNGLDVASLQEGAEAADVLTLLNTAKRFVRKLESPFQRVHDFTTLATQLTYCLLILEDLGLWAAWRAAGGGEASLTELWERCAVPCDIALLRRFMAMMAANDIIEEAGDNRWRPTAVSLALGDKESKAYNALMWWKKVSDPSCRNLPKFLARTNYQNPLDPAVCNFMDVTGPERYNCWELFTHDPELRRNFSGYMKGQLEYRLDWTQVYDISGILKGFPRATANGNGTESPFHDEDLAVKMIGINGYGMNGNGMNGNGINGNGVNGNGINGNGIDNKVLLVDVGGSHGHDLEMVLARAPDLLAGSLVLQDLPDVLEDAGAVNEKIVKMPYDFFEPQPVIGSRAYLLHWVLHDWNDADAHRILKNTMSAMTKGYSRLLVCDYSMPPVGATRTQTSSDFAMMHLLSAADRTEKSWLAILEGAGLAVIKIWKHPVSGDSVFEAVLAD